MDCTLPDFLSLQSWQSFTSHFPKTFESFLLSLAGRIVCGKSVEMNSYKLQTVRVRFARE